MLVPGDDQRGINGVTIGAFSRLCVWSLTAASDAINRLVRPSAPCDTPGSGKPLRARTTTPAWKRAVCTRVNGPGHGNNVRDWAIRFRQPKRRFGEAHGCGSETAKVCGSNDSYNLAKGS